MTTSRKCIVCGEPMNMWVATLVLACLGIPAGAQQQDATLVTIEGGADTTLHNYEWKVTNHHTSPIVKIEFPHFRADLFHIPRVGWQQETTNLRNVGVPDEPGVCIAKVVPPATGIRQGQSEKFGMRIAGQRAYKGRNTVTVTFADETVVAIPGVELPVPPEPSSKWIQLIGLGAIFVIWVAYRTLRGRSGKSSPEGAGEEAHESPEA